MPLKGKVKPAKGGKRPGAGRKPKAATVARKALADANVTTAQEAFDLVVRMMRDIEQKPELRVDCAMYIQDRVWGKPTVSVRNDPDLPVLVDDLPV